jgi:O-antigen/teichoic acid export membrane protein
MTAVAVARLHMSSRVVQNIAANFFGRGWGALLSIVLTPIYIELLGIEAYGLVGFFITLQAMLGVLDMGLGAAATREAAVFSGQTDGVRETRNLMRTLEWIYWGVASVIALVICLLASPIAHYWVNPQTLQPAEVRTAIMLMACVFGAQWPTSLYGGVLMGLQMQTSANILQATFATLRALGAVLVIQMSPSVVSFFQWQVFVSIVQTIATAAYVWKQVPAPDHKPRFDVRLLHQIKRFAAEMSGMTLMATAFMQLDKLVLSRVLTLEHFGYYFAAVTAASGLYIIISPIFAALFPRFSQLLGRGEEASIRLLYDRASQLMAAAALPAMAVMVFFAEDLLMLWTRDPQTAENGATVLALLAIGNTLNGLMNVPYALQLASGKATLVLKANAVLMLVSVPAIIVLAYTLGGTGAAIAWVGYTLAFWIANAVIVGKGFAYLDRKSWLWSGHIRPAAVALLVAAAGYGVRQGYDGGWGMIFLIVASTTAAVFIATLISSPTILQYVRSAARGH